MDHIKALPAGTRIEEYRLETVLGAGGFGITYRAHDTHLAKTVAIKEYLPAELATRTADSTVVPNSSADADDYRWGLARFLDEARTLARFDHPHLNKVHRFFEANGTAYLVLDYVAGEPLSAVLRQQKTLPAEELERLLSDVLSGLEAVHAAGYVHRDVKPGNLMVRPDGSTVLLDFGAARQAIGQRSKSVTAILTPGYAPIEQYDSKAEDVGPWSDLYALGMVAYRCVSGLSDGELPDAVTRSRNARKGLPDLRPAVEVGSGRYAEEILRGIDWAIAVNEEDRPQNVAAWRAKAVGHQGRAASDESTPKATLVHRSPASAPRNGWAGLAKAVVVIIVVAVIGGGAYLLGRQQPVPTPPVTVAAVPEAPGDQDMVQQPVQPVAPRVTPPVAVPPPPPRPDPGAVETALGLGRAERRLVQWGLRAAGVEPGPVDGLFGVGPETQTRRALRAWQAATGAEATGYLTREQADTLSGLGQEWQARADDAAYARATQADTAAAYADYLAAYPGGQHVREARGRETARREEEQARIDDTAYARARRTNTAVAYAEYLAAYPGGRHAQEAVVRAQFDAPDDEGRTALMHAARRGDTESVQTLLAGGAQPDVQNENGVTALIEAAFQGHTASVEALLAGGAQPDVQGMFGTTALMTAAWKGHTASVEALLVAGAQPNVQVKTGQTALMGAAVAGHTASVEALLAGGAQPNVQTQNRFTALMLAAAKGRTASVEALLAGGAQPNVRAENGQTAIDFARSNGHAETVRLLQAAGGRRGRVR